MQRRADPGERTFPVPGELTGMIGHTCIWGKKVQAQYCDICLREGGWVIRVVMESGVQNISYGITGSAVAKES